MDKDAIWTTILQLQYGADKEDIVCNKNDNQIIHDGNLTLELAMLSTIGNRPEQQDSLGYILKKEQGIVVICDGMGGHEGGQLASTMAKNIFLDVFQQESAYINPVNNMMECAIRADEEVGRLADGEGKLLHAGSTLVAICIKDEELYWCSVGDSRAYLYRDGEFVQFTQDQNYRTVLDEQLTAGLITREEYQNEKERGEALISYIGIGNLSLIDYSLSAIKLKKDDKIVVMSDGLYKLVKNEEIARIVENFSNINEAIQALEVKAKRNAQKNSISRDNMTIGLIRIK